MNMHVIGIKLKSDITYTNIHTNNKRLLSSRFIRFKFYAASYFLFLLFWNTKCWGYVHIKYKHYFNPDKN